MSVRRELPGRRRHVRDRAERRTSGVWSPTSTTRRSSRAALPSTRCRRAPTAVATNGERDADGETITYSISGSDASSCHRCRMIRRSSTSRGFRNPDADADGDGVYGMVVTAKAGAVRRPGGQRRGHARDELAPVIVGGNGTRSELCGERHGHRRAMDATNVADLARRWSILRWPV